MKSTKKVVKVKLSKPERRIAILKDALRQLQVKAYNAKPGRVCDINVWDLADGQLQKQLNSQFFKSINCECCQRGSLLLSTIRKENSFTLDNFQDISNAYFNPNSKVDKRLLKVFSAKQIASMEAAFEVQGLFNSDYAEDGNCSEEDIYNSQIGAVVGEPLSAKERKLAISFGAKFKDPQERQKAILKNAIKNKGFFKP